LVRRQDAGLGGTGESLPVLEAFQEFLETERRLTRTRMMALTAVFVAILVAVIAGGVIAALLYHNRIQSDNRRLQDDMRAITIEALKDKNLTHTALTQIGEQTRLLSENLARERQAGEGLREGLGAATPGPSAALPGVEASARVEEYARTVALLEQRLSALMALPPPSAPSLAAPLAVAAPVSPSRGVEPPDAALLAELARARAEIERLRQGPAVGIAPPAMAAAPRAARRTFVNVGITPTGTDREVGWRMPIPE
jgi:hypothetical protein